MSFTVFSVTTDDVTKVMDNFYYVFDGDRLPYSITAAGSLALSDNTVDLGSSVARWRNVYANTIVVNSSTITAPYMWSVKAQITLSATAASIEFTGLNGDAYEPMMVRFMCPSETTAPITFHFMYFNNVSTAVYVSDVVYWPNPSVGVLHYTNTFMQIGEYNKSMSDIFIYSKTGKERTVLSERVFPSSLSVQGVDIKAVWNNTANTLTTIKFIPAQASYSATNFEPGTKIMIWGIV